MVSFFDVTDRLMGEKSVNSTTRVTPLLRYSRALALKHSKSGPSELGGQGGDRPLLPILELTLSQSRGADYAYRVTTPLLPPIFSDLPTALHTCIIDRIGNKSKWVLKMKKEFDPGVKVNSKKKSFKHAKSFEKHLISLTNLFIFISHWKKKKHRNEKKWMGHSAH